MQDLHQHQHHEKLVQHQQCLGGNRPVTEPFPEHFAGVCNRYERRYKKQYGKDGIDNHFGFAQIVAKVDAELLLGHLGSLVELMRFAPFDRQSITISRLMEQHRYVAVTAHYGVETCARVPRVTAVWGGTLASL